MPTGPDHSPQEPLISDDDRYAALQQRQEKGWETACARCGACCGAVDGDPCEHLARSGDGQYFCRIYHDRFGLRQTISGRPFSCVPLRKILHRNWPGDQHCVYKTQT